MNKFALALTKLLVKDIGSDDDAAFNGAAKWVHDPEFHATLAQAKCPENIINAIEDTVELSQIERAYCSKQILAELKKIPTLASGD